MEYLRNINYGFMQRRRLWLTISLSIIALAWILAFLRGGLNLGIDFAGGTQMTLKFAGEPDVDRLRDALETAGLAQAQIQRYGDAGDHEVLVRAPGQEDESSEAGVDRVLAALDAEYGTAGALTVNRAGVDTIADFLVQQDPDGRSNDGAARSHYRGLAEGIARVKQGRGLVADWSDLEGVEGWSPQVRAAFEQEAGLGEYAVLSVDSVGPQVGSELRRKGLLAVVFSILSMLAYIWFRFELHFGIGAIVATLHDVMLTLPLFALTGFEFNLTTVAAFLTLVGFSVNDTVVIFDRVREHLRKNRRRSFEEVLNTAINETLSRTVTTGGTALLAALALLIFGGEVLRGFSFILTVGIIAGAFSTIYIAGPFALWWDETFGEKRRRREAGASSRAA